MRDETISKLKVNKAKTFEKKNNIKPYSQFAKIQTCSGTDFFFVLERPSAITTQTCSVNFLFYAFFHRIKGNNFDQILSVLYSLIVKLSLLS